ncbi:phosphotransferase enzyme family protein [Burkholderia stagnalis]
MRQQNRAQCEAAIAAHLKSVYGIDGTIETVVYGLNWTLRVCVAESPVAYVRLYRLDRSLDELRTEMNVLDNIESSDALKVSRSIRSQTGSSITVVTLPDTSRRFVSVFEPAQGVKPADTQSDYAAIGAALADLHRQTALIEFAPASAPGIGAVTGSVEKISMRSIETARVVAEAIQRLRNEAAVTKPAPKGFCHGDIRGENMCISGRQVTFFDFDDCGLGHQIIDVASVAFWLESGNHDAPVDLLHAFLDGYGIHADEALSRSIRWYVLQQQIRIARSLIDHCTLDDGLWEEFWRDTRRLAQNAASGRLKVLARL